MENNNESMTCNTCGQGGMGCGNSCGGSCHGGGGHHRFVLLRIFLGIIIIMVVFSVGVKVGEFKGEFSGYRNDSRMMDGNYYRPMPMMYYNNQAAPTTLPQ